MGSHCPFHHGLSFFLQGLGGAQRPTVLPKVREAISLPRHHLLSGATSVPAGRQMAKELSQAKSIIS